MGSSRKHGPKGLRLFGSSNHSWLSNLHASKVLYPAASRDLLNHGSSDDSLWPVGSLGAIGQSCKSLSSSKKNQSGIKETWILILALLLGCRVMRDVHFPCACHPSPPSLNISVCMGQKQMVPNSAMCLVDLRSQVIPFLDARISWKIFVITCIFYSGAWRTSCLWP